MPPLVIIGKDLEKWNGPIYQKCLNEGIWFLTKIPKNVPINIIKVVQDKDNYYFANEVGSYKPLNDDLLHKIAAIQAIEGSK